MTAGSPATIWNDIACCTADAASAIRFKCLLCSRHFHVNDIDGYVTALPNIASEKYVHCQKEFCKASNFAKHERSALHCVAREQYYNVTPADFCAYRAPTSKAFQIVWDAVIGHSSAVNPGFNEVGCSKNSRRRSMTMSGMQSLTN